MNKTLVSDNLEKVVEIEPKQIIGTRWNSWCDKYKDSVSVEFVDYRNCIYTAAAKKYPITYKINDGKLFLSCITGPFELRGDVLFNNDLPAFQACA